MSPPNFSVAGSRKWDFQGQTRAEEPDYMGFVSEEVCYVLQGRRFPVEIEACPLGARDIHHLEALVLDRLHPLDRPALAAQMNLPRDWSFEDLFERIKRLTRSHFLRCDPDRGRQAPAVSPSGSQYKRGSLSA